MIKKALFFIFLSCFAVNPMYNLVKAQQTDLKFGFINTQKLIADSKAGKAGNKTMQDLVDKHKKAIDEKGAEIKTAESELEKQYKTITEQARTEKEETINKQRKELDRMKEDAQAEVSAKEKSMLNDILGDVGGVIQQIGKDENFTVIFGMEGPSILYADPVLDITDKVVKKYDDSQKSDTTKKSDETDKSSSDSKKAGKSKN
jgi:outer membrane protein